MLDGFESRHTPENLQEKNFDKYGNESSVMKDSLFCEKHRKPNIATSALGLNKQSCRRQTQRPNIYPLKCEVSHGWEMVFLNLQAIVVYALM